MLVRYQLIAACEQPMYSAVMYKVLRRDIKPLGNLNRWIACTFGGGRRWNQRMKGRQRKGEERQELQVISGREWERACAGELGGIIIRWGSRAGRWWRDRLCGADGSCLGFGRVCVCLSEESEHKEQEWERLRPRSVASWALLHLSPDTGCSCCVS